MNGVADVTPEKALPNSIDSERAVLGAILLDCYEGEERPAAAKRAGPNPVATAWFLHTRMR